MLYPHQQKVIDDNPARHLLAHGTGTGKTITSLALAWKNCTSFIVVCPKALVPKWERDILNYAKAHFTEKPIAWKVLSKENFKVQYKTLPVFDGVIVDEAHYFAGSKSQLSKALYSYMKKHDIKYRWLLTATPYLSTPMNIYVLAKHLGYDWDYWAFQRRFFTEVRLGHRTVPMIKKGIEQELAALVREIGSTIDMEGAVELHPALGKVPDQVFKAEFFPLTKGQKKAISELSDDLFITRWTHAHCIENGFLYGDGYTETQTFESKKLRYLYDLVDNHKKVAVFCRYSHQLELLAKDIEAFGDHEVFIIDGSSTGVERDQIVRNADTAESAVILIQSQCSAGYELPSFDTIVFMSLSFSYVDYEQACGRFLRINRLKKNTYYHLVSNGVDKDVYDSIMKKQDFSLAIYDKKK
jgi:superfamily II DNA or RNA helicase